MAKKFLGKGNTCNRTSYLHIFFIAFITFALSIIPMLIYNNGFLTYYGDFNSQQIPFYYHVHEAVRNGNLFWDWGTDLGSDLLGSYSFYLLGSPFFWLTAAVPGRIVLYMMPWLLCLKYAFAAMTSYAYIKRFTKKNISAEIGALLYAFSGFQTYNIFFNHFHDVTAFFPLMLIALEETVNNDRRGFFAICVAFMASLNYFFFTGQAVFLIIYFLLRIGSKDFSITFKKFLIVAGEAIIGTCAAAIVLLPSALYILGNYRVSERLYGTDLIGYDDPTRIWRIIQSFFMIPDVPSRPNLFDSESARWSSIGGYLPLFSMIGVCSYLRAKPDKWSSKLIKVCIVCAFIPILNSAFYMFNASYYARWFYMPVLIMALVTAKTIESSNIDVKPGIKTCMWFFLAFLIISVLPVKNDKGVQWFGMAANLWYFYFVIGITLFFFIMAVRIFWLKKKKRAFLSKAFILTCAAALSSTCAVFYYGISIGPYPDKYISTAIYGGDNINLEHNDGEFYRIDVSENYDNFPMLWGYSSLRCFQSVVNSSIMEFYDSVGITRDVASRPDTSSYSLRGLFSVKYYFNKLDDNTGEELEEFKMPGFTDIGIQNGFRVYKNDNYVPMGFTYDSCISKAGFETISSTVRDHALMETIVLDEKQMEKYSALFESYKPKSTVGYTQNAYLKACSDRIQNSCTDFNYSTRGFSAKITTDKPNLVFFSVPYDRGFSAYVNSEKTNIENVNNGFMAVYVPAGESTIKFSYIPYGLETGFKISAASLFMILAYMIIIKINRLNHSRQHESNDTELTLEVGEAAPIAQILSSQNQIIDFPLDRRSEKEYPQKNNQNQEEQ